MTQPQPATIAGLRAALERLVQDALARWGRQPAPIDDRGLLPMIITDTGASDECERERIICASISGGADYINNMPRMLTLERIEWHKGSTCRRYIQEPTPPAEGDVAELVEWLHTYASEEFGPSSDHPDAARLTRAAELLQQQHPTPVPVSDPPGPDDRNTEGKCWWFSTEYPGEWSHWIFGTRPFEADPTHWLPAHALPLPATTHDTESND